MGGEGVRDQVVEAPVVSVQDHDRRLRLGPLPKRVAAHDLRSGPRQSRQLLADLSFRIPPAVEQHPGIGAELIGQEGCLG